MFCACIRAGRASGIAWRSTKRPKDKRPDCCPRLHRQGSFRLRLALAERACTASFASVPSTPRRAADEFASLDVTPLLDDNAAEVEIDEKDLRVDTYAHRGGDNSEQDRLAIRITHLPTNIVVSCQNERSQHQNRARAMQILEAKLAERARAERQAEMNALSGDRSDNAWVHRFAVTCRRVPTRERPSNGSRNRKRRGVLDGDLDDFMEAELRRQRFHS